MTMNFMREVIEIANQNDFVDFQKNTIRLLDEIKSYQTKVNKYIADNYVEFRPNLIGNVQLLDEGDRLLSEAKLIRDSTANHTENELLVAIDSMGHYVDELTELSITLRTSNIILRIDRLFEELKLCKTNAEFMRIIAIIDDIKTLMNDPADEILRELDCYDSIKIRWHIEHEWLLHTLKKRFEELVQFNAKQFIKTKSITLRITRDDVKLHETVIALIQSKYNARQMCTFLLENVFEPIISQPVSLQFDESRTDYVCLTLSYSNEPLAEDLRPDYKTVFKAIETVMQCLGYMNIEITDDLCVLGIFADHIKEPFFHLLKTKCLPYSLPTTMDEMNESTMIVDILSFNEFLCKMLFLQSSDTELRDYSEKIDVLFKNRFCTKILDSAVDIMQKDLHDMELVQEKSASTDHSAVFPRCMVSKSVLELFCLLEKVLRQASTSKNDELTARLLSTIAMILERYISEVPVYHQRLLLSVPQQTALLHNNCMYLAHWLIKNGTKLAQYVAIVASLQHCGTEHFAHQVSAQRQQIMEILRDFDLTGVQTELDIMPQKVVRQCLRQLDLLRNVWQPILPEQLYNTKTMGTIVNDFCAELIRRILIIEDISSSVSDGLVAIIDNVLGAVPLLFADRLQVTVLVKSWQKLVQLKMMLNASLADIVDQWAEGKGVLTLNYKADEVKKLIRALFQNTDRRSKALSTIF